MEKVVTKNGEALSLKERGEKLKKFFSEKRLKQREIAGMINTKQSYVSAVLNGYQTIGKNKAHELNEVFGLSEGWLLTGQGEMLADNDGKATQKGENNKQIANIQNSTATIHGDTNDEFIHIIKQQSRQIDKSQEQIDKLLAIIEHMQ